MNRSLEALNRAFEKAFFHTREHRMLPELLHYLGEELVLDRISIFEHNEEGYYRNSYEWCRDGIDPEQEFMQHLSYEELGTWRDRLLRDEIITIRDVASVRESDPGLYELLCNMGVRSIIVSALAFHGRTFGFFIMENPSETIIYGEDVILPGLRYILSSLVYSDYLIHQLERVGYSDAMTGAGNRLSLQSYLEQIDHEKSIGLVSCDIYSWHIRDSRPEHMRDEQMVMHAGTILLNIFGNEAVYRVDATEFLVVCTDVEQERFEKDVEILHHLMMERDMLTAVGTVWKENCRGTLDALIREAGMRMYHARRELTDAARQNNEKNHIQKKLWDLEEKASISMYRGEHFFEKGDQWLSRIFDENVVMAVIDINFFRLYNDIFGRKSGNLLLESIADSVTQIAREYNGIGGYLGNDDFCLMFPVPDKDYSTLQPKISEFVDRFRYTDGFAPIFGIYLSANREEQTITMYDRALAAQSEIKGSYTEQFRFYNEEHFRTVRENKILMLDAKKGLEKGEFLFYLQPQVNEKTGKIIGAEALIRWNRNGQIRRPKLFIEEMEKSGFIYSLDRFIWEAVCAWMRGLLDRGMQVLPVSVNVSRVDFYFADIAEVFLSLVQKYDLDPALIGIEITESAFTDNPDVIRAVTDRLHSHGFRIYMDDFGSGSSSLSMLYQLNVDVLKTDIHFLRMAGIDEKATSIVESVISMAHMIGMVVIAEGVETEEQKNSLIEMGDTFVQGYYFYRPMPVEEYEKLLSDPEKIGEPPVKGGPIMTSRLHFRDMMSEGILNDTLLDNIIGAAAVYMEKDGVISIVQMNEAYSQLTGIDPDDHDGMGRFIRDHYRANESIVREAFHRADHSLEGTYSEAEFWRDDGSKIVLRGRIFLLYSYGDHTLYMSTILQE